MSAPAARKQRGFTILELLITLLLISVLAAVAIPAFFARPEVTLENASILLAHDLRTAQNRSAYLSEGSRFEFYEDGDGYRVLGPTGEVVRNPATGLPFVRSYGEDAVFAGVRVVEVEAEEDDSILYDAQGRASTAARITLEFGGDRRIVVVKERAGSIEIEGSTSGWIDRGY